MGKKRIKKTKAMSPKAAGWSGRPVDLLGTPGVSWLKQQSHNQLRAICTAEEGRQAISISCQRPDPSHPRRALPVATTDADVASVLYDFGFDAKKQDLEELTPMMAVQQPDGSKVMNPVRSFEIKAKMTPS